MKTLVKKLISIIVLSSVCLAFKPAMAQDEQGILNIGEQPYYNYYNSGYAPPYPGYAGSNPYNNPYLYNQGSGQLNMGQPNATGLQQNLKNYIRDNLRNVQDTVDILGGYSY